MTRQLRSLPSLVLTACLSLVLAGCGSGANSGSGGSGGGGGTTSAPQVSLTASSITFASTNIAVASAQQSVTLTNSGNATLTFSGAPALSGANTGDFAVTTTCGTTLAASATCIVSATFTPTVAGTRTATITLSDNANNATSTQTITLSGTGAASTGIASLSPASITFPDTTINTSSVPVPFTLSNVGTGPLTITGTTTSLPAAFTITSSCTSGSTTASILAGGSCTFSVTFKPTTTGVVSVVYAFTDNSGGNTSSQSVTISGNGTTAATPSVTLSPTTLAFPSTVAGNTATAITATLANGTNATLTGITPSITGGSTASAFTVASTTCGTTLAANSSCTFSITFKPTANGSYAATLSVADSATNTPQTANLTGTGTAPALSLSPTSINFPTTTLNTTTSAYTATLSNTGTATANISSIAYSGSSTFTSTNNCGTTLAAGASCTISNTFTPTTTSTTTGTVTVTSSNVTPATYTLSLSGTGTTSTTSYQLYLLPDPGTGNPGTGTMAALYALVNNAKTSIDLTIYELQDTTFANDLATACGRGVKVRVILDQGHKSNNASTYSTVNAAGSNCSAVYSTSYFSNTHEKCMVIDGTTIALMSLNLQTQYYTTTRDYALIYNDPVDYAAIEATFVADYAVAGTSTNPGNTPSTGNDLIWSPTTSYAEMANIINNAKNTLVIENEEFSSSEIISAVAAACQRLGSSNVMITIENTGGSYNSGLTTIKNAGCAPHEYTSSTGFYVHGKSVVADYGLSTQKAYMGSINYSDTSMKNNRELGIYLPDQAAITLLYNTVKGDYTSTGATVF